MKQFHAHVYFADHEILAIKQLRQKAENSPLTLWKLFEQCVGPHALPMLELHFDESKSKKAIAWLRENHGTFSVLIHEDTGDDFKDHEYAMWLGTKLPIRFEFFSEVKEDSSLAVHAKS
jgi:aromatic ring-cleaving dioxygenase